MSGWSVPHGSAAVILGVLFFFGAGLRAHAQAVEPELRVIGATTLQPEVIRRLSGLDSEPQIGSDEIRRRLLNTNLFSYVVVERSESVVTVRLHQKVDWFVVPYYSSDPAGSYYSLAAGKAVLAHQDVFGYGFYQVGTNDHEASVGFKGQALGGSRWNASLTYDYLNRLDRIYEGRELSQPLLNYGQEGAVEVSYRAGLYWRIALKGYFEFHRFEQSAGQVLEGYQWSQRVQGEYDEFYSVLGVGVGKRFTLTAETTDPWSDFHFYKLGGEAQVSVFQRGNTDWVTKPSAWYSATLPRYQLYSLGSATLRGFPAQQFYDRWYLSDQNDFLIALIDFGIIRVRPMAVADWAFIQGSSHVGAGGGVQIGVRDVALSAVQILATYGWNPNGFILLATLGQHL